MYRKYFEMDITWGCKTLYFLKYLWKTENPVSYETKTRKNGTVFRNNIEIVLSSIQYKHH